MSLKIEKIGLPYGVNSSQSNGSNRFFLAVEDASV